MVVPEILYSVVNNKCPRCHKGNLFEGNNPYSFKNGLTMNTTCSECGLKYESEPGFFYGSLYVNYALSSGVFIVLYLSDALWIHMDTVLLLTIVVVSLLGLYPLTYRWGRLFWINFFIRYDKSYRIEKQNQTTILSKQNNN
jgi:uncharacterized protein (DUF983 family)